MACVITAFALRIGFAGSVDFDPRSAYHFDATWYDLAALTFADGRLLRDAAGVPTAFWPPGYPIALGASYAVFGESLRVAQVLHAVLAALSCGFVYAFAARVLGHSQALVAGWLLALFPGYIFLAPVTLSENAFVACFASVLWAFGRWNERFDHELLHWAVFGALIGLATLTRGAASLFLAVPFAIWCLGPGSRRRTGLRTAAAALGIVLTLAPWTLRNALVLGSPIAGSTSVGMALTWAHSPVSDGSNSLATIEYREKLIAPFQELPNPERELASMRFEVERAFAFSVSHPRREVELMGLRLFHLFQHDHAGLDWLRPTNAPARQSHEIWSQGADRVLAAFADAYYYAILALAGLGAWAVRRRPTAWILPLSVAYIAVLHGVLFVGDPRYHAPLYPVLALLAAEGCVRLRDWRRPQSR